MAWECRKVYAILEGGTNERPGLKTVEEEAHTTDQQEQSVGRVAAIDRVLQPMPRRELDLPECSFEKFFGQFHVLFDVGL